MEPVYKIVEPNEDSKLSKIEKTYEHKVQFTLQQIEDHEVQLDKSLKELDAKIEMEKAKQKNVEDNHAFVTEMPKEQLATCKIYFDALASEEMCQKKRNEVVDLLNLYSSEKKEILKQLGLETPTPVESDVIAENNDEQKAEN